MHLFTNRNNQRKLLIFDNYARLYSKQKLFKKSEDYYLNAIKITIQKMLLTFDNNVDVTTTD